VFDMEFAHRRQSRPCPMPRVWRGVTNLGNGKSLIVAFNERGPVTMATRLNRRLEPGRAETASSSKGNGVAGGGVRVAGSICRHGRRLEGFLQNDRQARRSSTSTWRTRRDGRHRRRMFRVASGPFLRAGKSPLSGHARSGARFHDGRKGGPYDLGNTSAD